MGILLSQPTDNTNQNPMKKRQKATKSKQVPQGSVTEDEAMHILMERRKKSGWIMEYIHWTPAGETEGCNRMQLILLARANGSVYPGFLDEEDQWRLIDGTKAETDEDSRVTHYAYMPFAPAYRENGSYVGYYASYIDPSDRPVGWVWDETDHPG